MSGSSTFAIGATTCTFVATIQGHEDGGEAPFRVMRFRIRCDTTADWAALDALKSRISKTAMPSGGAKYQTLNGPGIGALTIAGLGGGTAYLTDVGVDRVLPAPKRFGRVTFEIATWTPT